MSSSNYLSPEELINLYPQVKLFDWSSSKVGISFGSELLLGHGCGKEYKALILNLVFKS